MKKTLLMGLCLAGLQAMAWQNAGTQLRQDHYPFDMDEPLWAEAWWERNQFFPRYFKTSATAQAFVKNDQDKPVTPKNILFNGKPIADVTTRPDYAGPVIWYRLNPETVAPGQVAQLTVRLRKTPTAPIQLQLDGLPLTVAPQPQKIRLQDVRFNFADKTLMVYVRSFQECGRIRHLEVNGQRCKANVYNSHFRHGAPALLVAKITQLPAAGSYATIKVQTCKAETMEQLRVLDSRFYRGTVSGNTDKHRDAGFDFSYGLHGGNYWKENGMIRLNPVNNEKELKKAATLAAPGEYIYGNHDEPDAREAPGLPYMERCGVNIMKMVEPLMKLQRKHGGPHPTGLMIDTTYAPLNWYTYGALADIPFNDCYVPTPFHGYDSHRIANAMKTFQCAVEPRPAQLMLWANCNTNFTHSPRATAPIENEVQVHYAIGSGVKGIHYFVDWSSFPQVSEGGFFVGFSQIPQLWKATIRGNALLDRLTPLLQTASRWPAAISSKPEQLWCDSILAGPQSMVISAANRRITVHSTDKFKFVHVQKTDATITARIPDWFKDPKLYQVAWNGFKQLDATINGKELTIDVKQLTGGAVYVLTTDSNIEQILKGNADLQAHLAKLSAPAPKPAGTAFAAGTKPSQGLDLSQLKDQLVLDFSKPETMKLVSDIRLTNAELILTQDGMLSMVPGKDLQEAKVELDIPLRKVTRAFTAKLQGFATPGYWASMELGIGKPGQAGFTTKASIYEKWFNGLSNSEFLQLTKTPEKETDTYIIRITLRDPLLVEPDGVPAAFRKLTITPEQKK